MTQLAADVNATARLWEVDVLPESDSGLLTIGSETVALNALFPGHILLPTQQVIPPRIRVTRGADNSTAASHTAGAAITAASVVGSGGAAEPGTLVADPPELAPDLVDALGAANAPGGGNPLATLADVGDVRSVARTLSTAEIETLFSEPVELIAGEVDVVMWPVGVFAVYRFGTTPFTSGTPSTELRVGWPGLPHAFTVPADNLIFTQEESLVSILGENGVTIIGQLVTASGAPLTVYLSDDDPTPGGDGTLDVVLVYRAVDVS